MKMKKVILSALLAFGLMTTASTAFAAVKIDGKLANGTTSTAKSGVFGTGNYTFGDDAGFGPAFQGAEGRFNSTLEVAQKDANTFHLSWEEHSYYDENKAAEGGVRFDSPSKMVDGKYYVAVYTGWKVSPKSYDDAAAALAGALPADNKAPDVSNRAAGLDTANLVAWKLVDKAGVGLTPASEETLTIPGGIKADTNYVFSIKAVNAAGDNSIEYFAYYLAKGTNDSTIHTASFTGQKIDGNGGYNAPSGTAVMDRAWKGQKTHGNYQYNTNSCAGCHKFHQGQGEFLLFASTEHALCESCHDGSAGQSNISMADQNAGVFNEDGVGSVAGDGTSQHDVAATNLSAAPGGDQLHTTNGWGATLECSSCHNPHGAAGNPHGSDQGFLLRFDNAGISNNQLDLSSGTGAYKVLASAPGADGTTNLFVNQGKYIFVKGSGKGGELAANYYPYVWVNELVGYMRVTATITGTPDSGALDATGSFLTGTPVSPVSNLTVAVNVRPNMMTKTVNGKNVDYTDNNSYWSDGTHADAGAAGAAVSYKSGAGQSLSLFCMQCHTDYLTGTRKNPTGVYSTAMRHKTNSDGLSCTRCHFAHGTSEDAMRDAAGYSAAEIAALPTTDAFYGDNGLKIAGDSAKAKAYIKDTGVDPANKRFTGFSVCLQCHADGALGVNAVGAPSSGKLMNGVQVSKGTHLEAVPY